MQLILCQLDNSFILGFETGVVTILGAENRFLLCDGCKPSHSKTSTFDPPFEIAFINTK